MKAATTFLPERFRRPSLRLSLIAIIFLVLVPTMLVVGVALINAGASLRDVATRQLHETAHNLAESTASELDVTGRMLLRIAEATEWKSSTGQPSSLSPVGGTLTVYHVRRNGPSLRIEGTPPPPTIAAAVLAAAREGGMRITNILAYPGSDKPYRLAMAVADRSRGAEICVATVVTTPSGLIRSLARHRDKDGSVVLAVTDGMGRIIGRSLDGGRMVGKPVPDWNTLLAIGADEGTFRAATIEGPPILFAFQKIPGTPGWVAVTGESAAHFDRRWQQPIFLMIALSAGMIAVAAALAMALAQKVVRPIRRIAERAERIADGDDADVTAIADDIAPSFVREFETLRVSLDKADNRLRSALEESRQAEQAASERNVALRQAESLARIGSWSLDLASGRLTCSETLYDLHGASPEVGPLTMADLADLLGADNFRKVRDVMALCAETGEPKGLEIEHRRWDGKSFGAYVQTEAIRDEQGRIVRIIGTVQDISERRDQRERLSALADNLPSGVIFRLESTGDGRLALSYVSAGIQPLTGLSAAEAMARPERLEQAIPAVGRRVLRRALARSRHKGCVLDCEFPFRTPEGRVICMHCRAAFRRLDDRRIVWDGIARDVTAEREAERALRAAKNGAEAAEKAKGDFLAAMSHEIRTPMNSVIGMTRLALRTDLDPKQHNYLQKIDRSASTLLRIIDDILDFSKIEAGGLELEGTTFDLEAVLEDVASATVVKAEEKGIELAFSLAPGTPFTVRGDPLRLGQVLTNLVGNAVKFTETGEVVVSVSPAAAGKDGRPRLQFAVRDTGIGLSAEQIGGLFRPFTQASSDTSRHYGGTGLGLAICKRLVAMMGGAIEVESQPGMGSTFRFTAVLEAVDNAERAARHAHPTGLHGRRVLVVDDNDGARMALVAMVDGLGAESSAVADGQEALRQVRQAVAEGRPFDVVLLDWHMPEPNGLEIARRIRGDASLPHVPAVLMVTAYGEAEVRDEAAKAGIRALLGKPVTPSVLFDTLLDVLALPAAGEAEADGGADPVDLGAFAALAGKRVLVVDDNAFNREVAMDFLDLVGVRAEAVGSGRQALARVGEKAFDAVLMDMHMPDMDGLATARALRRQPGGSALPIIALTAQARPEDRQASLEAGMNAHIAKPIDEYALYGTLMDLLVPQPGHVPGPDAGGGNTPGEAETVAEEHAGMPGDGADAGWLAAGHPDLMERLVPVFLRDFGDAEGRFDAALAAGDLSGLAHLVHRVKGTVGYFRAERLYALSGVIEQAARDGDRETVARHAPDFRAELRGCIAYVASLGNTGLRNTGLRNTGPKSPAPKGVGDGSAPVDDGAEETVLGLVEKAIPLAAQGDYAVQDLLDRLKGHLADTPWLALVQEGQELFDELELPDAVSLLVRLRDALKHAAGEEGAG